MPAKQIVCDVTAELLNFIYRCTEYSFQHFVYSSVASADQNTISTVFPRRSSTAT